MSKSSLARLLVVALALPLAACAAYRAQHQAAAPAASSHEAVPVAVRPSGEFSELAPDLQIGRVKGEVKEVEASLAQQGRYSCCVEPPCTECLLRQGECHCRGVVRQGGPSCGECTGAWIEGKGTVEGVTAQDLLERSREQLEEGKGNGKEKPPEPQPPH